MQFCRFQSLLLLLGVCLKDADKLLTSSRSGFYAVLAEEGPLIERPISTRSELQIMQANRPTSCVSQAALRIIKPLCRHCLAVFYEEHSLSSNLLYWMFSTIPQHYIYIRRRFSSLLIAPFTVKTVSSAVQQSIGPVTFPKHPDIKALVYTFNINLSYTDDDASPSETPAAFKVDIHDHLAS